MSSVVERITLVCRGTTVQTYIWTLLTSLRRRRASSWLWWSLLLWSKLLMKTCSATHAEKQNMLQKLGFRKQQHNITAFPQLTTASEWRLRTLTLARLLAATWPQLGARETFSSDHELFRIRPSNYSNLKTVIPFYMMWKHCTVVWMTKGEACFISILSNIYINTFVYTLYVLLCVNLLIPLSGGGDERLEH